MSNAVVERRDFLVEVGTEELPPKTLSQLEAAFATAIISQLDQLLVKHGSYESFSTPRRLAVLVKRLHTRQPDQALVRRGPPLRAAFDSAGHLPIPTGDRRTFTYDRGQRARSA